MKSTFGQLYEAYGHAVRIIRIDPEDIVVVSKELKRALYPRSGCNWTDHPSYDVVVTASPDLIRKLKYCGLEHCLRKTCYFHDKKNFTMKYSHWTAVGLKGMRNQNRKNAKVDAANAEMEKWIEESGEDFVRDCRTRYAQSVQQHINDGTKCAASRCMGEMLESSEWTKPETAVLQDRFDWLCAKHNEIKEQIRELREKLREAKVQERLAEIEKNTDDPDLRTMLERGLRIQASHYG